MFNKELFDKICEVNCTWDELEKFSIDIYEKEFDLDNPFSKYYSVDNIICAIEKYQSKIIDAKYLAYWMTAYDWIIMGGFKIEDQNEGVTVKKFLIWVITDWIDGLSFFDGDDDWYNLEEYKTTFKVLDLVLKDITNCRAIFAQQGDNEEDAVVLITNDNAKYFIKVYGELNYNSNTINLEKVEENDLENQAKQLLNLGYRELKYCDWCTVD